MASAYPGALDSFDAPATTLAGPPTHNDLHLQLSDALAAVQAVLGTNPGVPASFTPAMTSTGTSPTLGTGSSVAGRYAKISQKVSGVGSITFGTSGVAAGSGSYRVSLPVAASTTHQAVSTGPGNGSVIGSGTFVDASTGNVYTLVLHLISATTASLMVTGTGTVVTASSPVAPAASDLITYRFDYFTD